MSLKNQSNFYGVKAIQEKCNNNGQNANFKRFYSLPNNEDSTYIEEASVSCDCSSNDTPSCGCSKQSSTCGKPVVCPGSCPPPTPPCPQPTPPCPSPCPQPTPPCPSPCPQPTPPCPSPCPPPTPPCPCNNTGGCDECGPSNNCCNGVNCNFDPCNARCVCSYMNVLYDEKVATGSTMFNVLTATTPNYIITTEFNQSSSGCGGCCTCNCGNTCSIDSTSSFTIDSVNTTIKSFTLTGTTLSTSSILIGGKAPLSVNQTSYGYSAVVDPSVLNQTCTCNTQGTKSNVIIQGLSGWNYFAKYIICGKVSTNGSTCQFKITVENSSIPDVVAGPLTFASPDVCLPTTDGSNPIIMDINFGANGQLVNPVISAVGGPSPMPVTLTVSGNVMLATEASLYVTKQSKVCVQGNVF